MTFTVIAAGDPALAAIAMQNFRHVNYGNDLLPVNATGVSVDSTLNCGSSTKRWSNIYSDGLDVAGNGLFTGKVGIGSSYSGYAIDDLIVGADEVGVDKGIGILSNSADKCILRFMDGTTGAQEYAGEIRYDHALDSMILYSGAAAALTLNSSQAATFAGAITGVTTLTASTSLEIGSALTKMTTEGILLNRSGGTGYVTWQDGSAANKWSMVRSDATNLRIHASGVAGQFFKIASAYNQNEFIFDIDNARLGIGGDTPTELLHVGTNATAANTRVLVVCDGSSTYSPGFKAGFDDGGNGVELSIPFDTRASKGGILNATAYPLTLQTSGTDALTIDTSQNATFAGAINLSGNIVSDTVAKLESSSSYAYLKSAAGQNMYFDLGDRFVIRDTDGGSAERFTVDSANGNVVASGSVTAAEISTSGSGNALIGGMVQCDSIATDGKEQIMFDVITVQQAINAGANTVTFAHGKGVYIRGCSMPSLPYATAGINTISLTDLNSTNAIFSINSTGSEGTLDLYVTVYYVPA